MPLLRKGSILPVLGVDFSKPSTFLDPRNGFPTNMRYDKSELRKRPGKTDVGAQSSNATQIMGFGRLELSTGAKHLVRATKRQIESLNTASDTWSIISIINYDSGNEDFFNFVTVTEDGLLISNNYVNPPYKWDGSGNQQLLGGSPPSAKYGTYVSPHVLFAYLLESGVANPWKVAWSDTNAPETWSGGNSGSALLADEPSIIQNILKLNEFAAVYKKESLILGRKVETSDIFIFDTVETGVGLGSPRAVAEAEGSHYFMGLNDFYCWNGIRTIPIGGSVKDDVFSRINRTLINRCFAVHVQELQEVWFFVVISGDTWPKEVWKYNYRLGYWFFDTADNITAAIKWERTTTTPWNDASGTWDQQQTSWDASVVSALWEDIMFGTSDGYAAKLDYTTTNDRGSAVSASFITKDFVADTLEIDERWLQLDVWAKGPGRLYIDYSTDFGSTWTNIPYTSSQAWLDTDETMRKYEWYFDVWASRVRFRFRNSESGETFYVQSFYPYYLQQEEVRTFRS